MGSTEDPSNGIAVASAIFGAVAVYGFFLLFCATQAFMHMRASKRGGIALS